MLRLRLAGSGLEHALHRVLLAGTRECHESIFEISLRGFRVFQIPDYYVFSLHQRHLEKMDEPRPPIWSPVFPSVIVSARQRYGLESKPVDLREIFPDHKPVAEPAR